ncbi:hypothetical protein ACJX0J_019081 [Zea mays]
MRILKGIPCVGYLSILHIYIIYRRVRACLGIDFFFFPFHIVRTLASATFRICDDMLINYIAFRNGRAYTTTLSNLYYYEATVAIQIILDPHATYTLKTNFHIMFWVDDRREREKKHILNMFYALVNYIALGKYTQDYYAVTICAFSLDPWAGGIMLYVEADHLHIGQACGGIGWYSHLLLGPLAINNNLSRKSKKCHIGMYLMNRKQTNNRSE